MEQIFCGLKILQFSCLLFLIFGCALICEASTSIQTSNAAALYTIDGRALMPGVPASDWIGSAKINVNGDAYHGFFRADGSFTVTNVPSGV